MRIIVVDNDCHQSALSTVNDIRDFAGCQICYVVEPRQSISHARNLAMKLVSAELFAFVDDDEVICENWLKLMLSCIEKYQADVVFGPVIGVLPADAPQWATKHRAFNRPRRKTGSPVLFGGCGNVLIRRASLGSPLAEFDITYGLTGGEDTEFFHRMRMTGGRFVWCDEALAYENVPPERLTPRWVRRRGYRSGQSYARIVISSFTIRQKLFWFFKKCFHLISTLTVTPFARILSYSVFLETTVALCRVAGQLSIVLKFDHYEEYQVPK